MTEPDNDHQEQAGDVPTVMHPVVRRVEQEAIRLYRERYPDGPLWTELSDTTRHMWVSFAEITMRKGESQ